jgi:hypothetical protein
MSLNHSPSIITNGLIFGYDQPNIKSYRGPVMQNLANQISILGTGTGTGYSSTAITETVDIPQLGLTTVYSNVIQNNYTSYSPNSGDCCPSLQGWGSFVVSPSTLYTYAIVYRCDSGYTNPNYMYRYEFTSNGGSYVTEGGVHNASNRVHLGGEWYYAWGTFTTQATTNWIGHAGTFYYRYFNLADKLSIAKVMIVAGNYSDLHPKYWPNQATTRTNTQAILDLTNNSTTTASSLTYASDGAFRFDGGQHISIPDNPVFNMTSGLTIEAWVKFDGNSDDFIFEKGDVNTQYSLFSHSTDIVFRTYHTGDGGYHTQNPEKSAVGITNGVWVHIVGSWDGSYKRIFVNGELKNEVAKSGTLVTTSKGSSVGRFGGDTMGYYFNGSIPKIAIYNRGLSALEVQQNFNALRGRYGI